jgi:glutamate racemase
MNIGIFDSGLGGLIIAKSLIDSLPEYDFVYLGDTAHRPYGNKSIEKINLWSFKAAFQTQLEQLMAQYGRKREYVDFMGDRDFVYE